MTANVVVFQEGFWYIGVDPEVIPHMLAMTEEGMVPIKTE